MFIVTSFANLLKIRAPWNVTSFPASVLTSGNWKVHLQFVGNSVRKFPKHCGCYRRPDGKVNYVRKSWIENLPTSFARTFEDEDQDRKRPILKNSPWINCTKIDRNWTKNVIADYKNYMEILIIGRSNTYFWNFWLGYLKVLLFNGFYFLDWFDAIVSVCALEQITSERDFWPLLTPPPPQLSMSW